MKEKQLDLRKIIFTEINIPSGLILENQPMVPDIQHRETEDLDGLKDNLKSSTKNLTGIPE